MNLAQSHEDMIGCRYHIPVIIVVAELLSQVYEAVQYFALVIEAGHARAHLPTALRSYTDIHAPKSVLP